MKITVLMPTPQHRKSAGARIRYHRTAEYLKLLGHALEVETLDNLPQSAKDSDVVIFSKCYGAESIAFMRQFKSLGITIGIDLFDDVFSQTNDSRLLLNRIWLADASKLIDFCICSTTRISEVLRKYAPDVSVHQLNDPVSPFDFLTAAKSISTRLEEAQRTRVVRVCWFGIGDNPNFPVGLRDLSAYSSALSALHAKDYEVKLRILTNRRALNVSSLQRLSRLPFSYSIEEWSEKAEKDALESSLVTFIPVNNQPFSIAKSWNRAMSALTGGSQVLNVGNGLYDRLQPLIYNEAADISADIESGQLRLRRETLPVLMERILELGDPARESSRFAAFLSSMVLQAATNTNPLCETTRLLVYGYARKPSPWARDIGIRVGTPFSAKSDQFDVKFEVAADGVVHIFLNYDVLEDLAPGVLLHANKQDGLWSVPLKSIYDTDLEQDTTMWSTPNTGLVSYQIGMGIVCAACRLMFIDCSLDLYDGEPPYVAGRTIKDFRLGQASAQS